MNLQQLFEANILNLDAITAAIEFPMEFKQELVKVVNRVYKVDKTKTFKSNSNYKWDLKQKDWRLYNEYGTADSGSSYSSRRNNMGINIFLHNGDYIKFNPDTMGNVNVNGNKIQIQGKTVKQFLDEIPQIITIKNKPNNKSGKAEKGAALAADIENIEFVKNAEYREPSGGYGTHRDYKIVIEIEKAIDESTKDSIREEARFYSKISSLIDQNAYLKTVYKKKTGNSPGRKGESGGLAGTINRYGLQFAKRSENALMYQRLKEVVISVNKLFKNHGMKISSISADPKWNGYFITFKIHFGTETTKRKRSEREVSYDTSFNIYDWLKTQIDEDHETISTNYRNNFNEKLLPIAQQIIKQYFKDK